MARNSGVEWCDHSWGPWRGCHPVDLGCDNCYRERGMSRGKFDPHKVVRAADPTFWAPLKWKEPARIFVCPWSDFFIEEADQWRDDAWKTIYQTSHLTYIIPTKQPELIQSCLLKFPGRDAWAAGWDNVWLGISASDWESFEKRWIEIMKISCRIRFVSFEPLLGPIGDFGIFDPAPDWVIVGGESGPNARPMHPDWVREIRDECLAYGIPFFFKSFGEWKLLREYKSGSRKRVIPRMEPDENGKSRRCVVLESGTSGPAYVMQRVGRRNAGHLLDGKEWHQWPE